MQAVYPKVWMVVAGAVLLAAVPAAAQEVQLQSRLDALEREMVSLRGELSALRAQEEAARREELARLVGELELSRQPLPTDFRVHWRDGLRFDSADGNFGLRIGGRVHHDWWWVTGSRLEEDLGIDLEDGARFRRARIDIDGVIYGNLLYRAQYDFASGGASFKDMFVGLTNVPWLGLVTVGQVKEPFGLEELTSSNSITFMERSVAGAFRPAHNVGVVAGNSFLNNRVSAAAGLFREGDGQGLSVSDGGYNFTYRLTGVPLYEEEGNRLVHVGFAHSLRTPRTDVRYRQRPEINIEPRLVDTGAFDATRINLLGTEAAVVHGPLSVQAEYHTSLVNASAVGSPHFHGGYVQASCFLTGETRPYSTRSGIFGRVRPRRNFAEDGGWGAFELAGRYSFLDLNDGDIRGGRMHNTTVGLNWYLNPNMRVMFNYVWSQVDLIRSADAHLFAMRFQVDF